MRRLLVGVLLILAGIIPIRAAYAQDVARVVWEPIIGAVLYEVTITADEKASKVIWQDTCSANGIELDTQLKDAKYYHVRGIDYDHRPIDAKEITGVLSRAERADGVPMLLIRNSDESLVYPVYTWIPVLGANGYEIEVASRKMRSLYLSDREARRITVMGGSVFDYYEQQPLRAGVDSWYRVRALYENGGHSAWSKSVCLKKSASYYGAIGDSITHGGGNITHTQNEEVYAWTHYTNRKIVNLGLSGDVTERIADRLAREATDYGVKVLFIMGGINDLRAGSTAATVIDNLKRAMSQAKENKIRPILLTVPPCNPILLTKRMGYPLAPSWQYQWQSVNDWIREQEEYIDVAAILTDGDGYLDANLTTDGLHPDSDGKRKIGEAVRDYLDKHHMP